MDWEPIDGSRQRAKVPGGWIYEVREEVAHFDSGRGELTGWDWRVSCCFIPDANHEWTIKR